MKNNSSHILICAAVEKEIAGLRDRINASFLGEAGFSGKMFSGRIRDTEVMLLVTGPGLVNAAHALTAAVERRRPRLVIQTGCAGVFPQTGLRVGDIGVATEEIDAQLGIEAENDDVQPLLVRDLPFPTLKTDNKDFFNHYPVDRKWSKMAYDCLTLVFDDSHIRVGKGPFITVSTITATDVRARRIYDAHHACMENMEGSASAHIAAGYGIPFVEIRSASNIVGRRDKTAWDLTMACNHAPLAVYEFLQIIENPDNRERSIF